MSLIKVENGIALLDPITSQKIAEFEKQIKILKELEDEVKESILKEMQDKNLIKIDTEELAINYIAAGIWMAVRLPVPANALLPIRITVSGIVASVTLPSW